MAPSVTIPPGSWVLVTGANGFLASHTIKQFLERGYKVRGTVRDLEKSAWLVEDVFKPYADRHDFELVKVPDLAAEHAFDSVLKGISAIAHIATVLNFEGDPNKMIPPTIAGTTAILEAALKEPSVKSIVYTSSIVAHSFCAPGDHTRIDHDTWNEKSLELAWAPPPYTPERAFAVYAASKTAAERALWKFVDDKKPHFTVNSVLPFTILGEPLCKQHAESPFYFIKDLYEGVTERLAHPALVHTDVKDVAALHIAAVLDPEVKNARLPSWGEYCNWNDMLAILRKLCPERKFVDDLPGLSKVDVTTDYTQVFALLEKWAGQKGWKTLEETLADALPRLREWYP
ncbi:putative NAD dependent epimerase/dehydratase [Thozetella sp. PMI_491]|nr:putative NAD dependent epimerase/dehydratase [Thozetella sp. PMI_491]